MQKLPCALKIPALVEKVLISECLGTNEQRLWCLTCVVMSGCKMTQETSVPPAGPQHREPQGKLHVQRKGLAM